MGERERGYKITTANFTELDGSYHGIGVICPASTDAELPSDFSIPKHLPHVWDWSSTSGLLPADIYLRHCLLAMQKIGGDAEKSFYNETYLVDRQTTLKTYLEDGVLERVLAVRP